MTSQSRIIERMRVGIETGAVWSWIGGWWWLPFGEIPDVPEPQD